MRRNAARRYRPNSTKQAVQRQLHSLNIEAEITGHHSATAYEQIIVFLDLVAEKVQEQSGYDQDELTEEDVQVLQHGLKEAPLPAGIYLKWDEEWDRASMTDFPRTVLDFLGGPDGAVKDRVWRVDDDRAWDIFDADGNEIDTVEADSAEKALKEAKASGKARALPAVANEHFHDGGYRFHPVDNTAADKKHMAEVPEDFVLVPMLLSYGDYDNSTETERSNNAVFQEEFGQLPGVIHIIGSHGGSMVGIGLHVGDKALIETLQRLEEHPELDEEAASDLKMQMVTEAWDEYGRADMIREIEEKLGISITDEGESTEAINELLQETYWNGYVEGGGSVAFGDAPRVSKKTLRDVGVEFEEE